MFRHYAFSEAWRLAVNLWADENNILPEDRERILISVPEPEQFKRLRRQMNDCEGCDVPVECLRPAFKEQREALAMARLSERSQKMELTVHPLLDESKVGTENEMLTWFERERQVGM